jgi:hypothetical protein
MMVYDLADFGSSSDYAFHGGNLNSLYYTADWSLGCYLQRIYNVAEGDAIIVATLVRGESPTFQAYWAA